MIKFDKLGRNKIIKKFTSILLTVALSSGLFMTFTTFIPQNTDVYAATVVDKPQNIQIETADGQTVSVRAIYVGSANEKYISLKDMAAVLNNTNKCYSVEAGGSEIKITKGASYSNSKAEPFSAEEIAAEYKFNKSAKLYIDGQETSYPCFSAEIGGYADSFVRIADFVMMMDINLTYDGVWHLDCESGFTVDVDRLVSEGYFECITSALTGDADTGEIFFEYNGSEVLEIASTTKLITYAVIKDAIRDGEISEDDYVTISENASRLSKGEDGAIVYEPGQSIPLKELMYAILLPSSNESALALAEHVCGSESIFVDRMNNKLLELSITDAMIYNCHGLPIYSDDAVSVKNQNRLSAEDMFKVVCYIISNYPEITEITSVKETSLQSVGGQLIKNTNGLMKNMPEVNGLKTGTTNKAGACLVATCRAQNASGEEHTLVAIEYGAENNSMRIYYGETLMRFAKQDFMSGRFNGSTSTTILDDKPKNAQKLISQIIESAKRQGIIE